MNRINLKGMGIALVTPFKKDESVDYQALSHLIDFQLKHGADYLVALGTTAETPTLTAEEQSEIIQLVVSRVKKQIPVVVGVSGNNTRAVVEKLQKDDFSGIDAILSVVPYYNKPSQEGIYQHYKAIARATELPVVMYNVPGRTGVNMTAETTLRLAREIDNIVAIKEASGNLVQVEEIIKNKPQDFDVISGDDGITLSLIELGAAGVISVVGNAFPEEFSNMVVLALDREYSNALIIHQQFVELIDLLFVDGSPAGIKCLLNMLGYIDNVLRLPLVPASKSTAEKIRNVFGPRCILSGTN